MAVLDRSKLLTDIKFWTPSSNVIDDNDIVCNIIVPIIASVGDDEANHAEVVCKSLRMVGTKNLTATGSSSGALKSEKIGTNEYEYYDSGSTGSSAVWVDFIDSLATICPFIGYTETTVISDRVVSLKMGKINSGTVYDPLAPGN